jgi:hypothetical protein
MDELIQHIENSASRIINHIEFVKWSERIEWEQGDLLLINNSFVFRDVKTTKSPLYLAYIFDGDKFTNLQVAEPTGFNTDFKRVPNNNKDEMLIKPLSDAIYEQYNIMGNLVYVLIGQIDDSIIQTVPLNCATFKQVVWDPSLTTNCVINDDVIHINQTFDEEILWNVVEASLADNIDKEELKDKFGHALDRLQDMAIAHLKLPPPGNVIEDGVTSNICGILKKERQAYIDAVAKLPEPTSLNEVLRIAYNFAGDATDYIRLIVSICDLKPLVQWGIAAELYGLSERFKQLPWSRRNKKPSLKSYESTIKDARNSAFHNLFPFRKSLSVDLPAGALEGAELRIFSEHSKKKENTLNYMDKPLVDVLLGFTRAREIRVPDRFWEKNIDVMDSIISLFEAAGEFLNKVHLAK